MLARLKSSGLLGPTVMTLAALPVLVGLGTWQLQRKTWKDGLQRQIDARTAAAPTSWRDLGEVVRSSPDIDYLRVRLEGSFDHSTERYLYWPEESGPGWLVLTLFKPGDDTRTVFVNRGWIPDALRAPETRAAGQTEGPAVVVGLVRRVEPPGRFTPPNEPQHDIWFWRDLAAMRNGTADPRSVETTFSIDAEATPANSGGWPKGGTTNLHLTNRHLEYVLTWYGLAATLIAVYLAFARGRLRRDPDTDRPGSGAA